MPRPIHLLAVGILLLVAASSFAPLVRGQSLETLHVFHSSDGAYPKGGLVQGTDGNFYGTTYNGGNNGYGTVFKMTTNGALTMLVSFDNYRNGRNPFAGLVQGSDGNFYGTTGYGSTNSRGSVFKMTPTGVLTTLSSLPGGNGGFPRAGLVQGSDGNFYGTTAAGGSSGYGTVFKITPNGVLTTLISFNNTNGADPEAGLVQASNGDFYGTTKFGGAGGIPNDGIDGTVFRITTNGALTELVSFNNTNGLYPSGLVLGRDGNFYGTTKLGGAGSVSAGTVFRMTPNGALTELVSFNNTNGLYPSGLVLGRDGNFYGTTGGGGAIGYGTVFRMTPNGTLVTLASFDYYSNGNGPQGPLVQGSDGNFYGTTGDGGANDVGTVFRIVMPATATATVTLGSLSQTYNGSARSATATTSPAGLTVDFTYNGSPNAPTNAGSYTVIGTINDLNYQGSATNTLVISKATATVTLGSLSQTYNGSARSATATTSPAGLTVNFTYNGSPNAPTNAGSYAVIGTINNLNYQGSATGTLVINLPVITTQPLSQTVNAGDTATFSVGVTGTGAQFQWRFNGTDLVGKTSSTLTLNSIGTNQAGIYRVLVTVGTVSLLSDPAELIVPFPGQPGSKKWQFTYGGAIDTTPALAKDGTIYVAADSALVALNPSGSQKWTLPLSGLLYGSPTVAADGTIYVGAWGAPTLYAINPNGTLRWSLNLPDAGGFTYPPSLVEDGTILVPIGGDLIPKKLYAVNTNGTPRWSFDAGGRPSGAAVAYDGTIYIGNNDTNQFFALHPDGTPKWDLMGIYNPTMPAIGADGTIYVGGFFDLQFRAFRPDGTMLWQYPTSAAVVGTTAVVGTEGTIYIATIWDGKLYALNPDGTLKWVHDLGDRTYIGLAVGKQGTIYTSANEKRFLAINPDGTTQWEFVTGSQDINPNEGRRSSPTIAPDGTIYFPVNQPGIGGVIFAIQGDSGPAESPWPMAYQNAQHTSRVPFAITNQPASQIVLSGSNAVFTTGVASTQPCVFQWRHNGGDLPNQTNATLILPNVALDAQGVYACLVSNRSGAYVSHNASLTVTTTFTLWITKQGVNVQLSWPVAYSNYTLLGSASLTGGAWITNSSPRTISGSNIFVTLPATNSRMFYRVVMP